MSCVPQVGHWKLKTKETGGTRDGQVKEEMMMAVMKETNKRKILF